MLTFVEATPYLLTLPTVQGQYILSERFSQDPLEDYFSRQRAKGGRCDNPTAVSSLQAAQSLRAQGSLALQPVRGNCSRKGGSTWTNQQLMIAHYPSDQDR